MRDCKIAKKDY